MYNIIKTPPSTRRPRSEYKLTAHSFRLRLAMARQAQLIVRGKNRRFSLGACADKENVFYPPQADHFVSFVIFVVISFLDYMAAGILRALRGKIRIDKKALL